MGKRMVNREMQLFTQPGQVARMVLPDGFRFVMFIRGETPQVIPINEPGEWEIDIPVLQERGKYPIGVTTVDAAHIRAIKTLPAEIVEDMLLAAVSTEGRGE